MGFGRDRMNSRSGIGKKALISNTAKNDFSFNKTKINFNERNNLLSQNVKYILNRPLLITLMFIRKVTKYPKHH